jgi:hypothetical protein
MKYKNLAIVAAVLAGAAMSNAQPITSFVNLDFDAGGVNTGFGFNGFDRADADIIGWRNLNDAPTLVDSGVEGPGAWWGPYEVNAAFMRFGDGAYNLSDYTIQAGDAFSIDFFARSWDGDNSQAAWTVSLFYDNPANLIGSYTTSLSGTWTQYSTPTPIDATGASVGGKLGIQFVNSGPNHFASVDEITVTAVVPEPTTISLVAVAGLGLLLGRRRLVKH